MGSLFTFWQNKHMKEKQYDLCMPNKSNKKYATDWMSQVKKN